MTARQGIVVAVTGGGKGFSDYNRVQKVLTALHRARQIVRVIHTGRAGVDRLAAFWATYRGIDTKEFPGARPAFASKPTLFSMGCPDVLVWIEPPPQDEFGDAIVAHARTGRVEIIPG